MTGMVFDIARFSLHDGPGIRTTVFLKGCPLRCVWCHNPESWKRGTEIFFDPSKCIGCGNCGNVCPEKCHRTNVGGRHLFRRGKCTGCGKCADACFSGALKKAGVRMTAGEVWAEAAGDRAYYGEAGGLTVSGGEPLFQPEFTRELLKMARAAGVHTCLETCGFAPWKTLRDLLPYTDLWRYDIKAADGEKHRKLTGVSNERILDNLARLNGTGAEIELRCPLVPGLNDAPEDLSGLRRIARSIRHLRGIEPEPYHPFGKAKELFLGRRKSPAWPVPGENELERYRASLKME